MSQIKVALRHLVLIYAATVSAFPALNFPHGNKLAATESLKPGDGLQSLGQRFELLVQYDGNIVIYDWGKTPTAAIWATPGTYGSDLAGLNMQDDGNLVAYDTSGKPVWDTKTYGKGGRGSYLILQDDGNLVVYTDEGAVWYSGSEVS